jgi:hypothetical protein
MFLDVFIYLTRSLSLKMFLVPIGLVPKWSGFGSKYYYIMVFVFSSRSRSKSLPSWPFGLQSLLFSQI